MRRTKYYQFISKVILDRKTGGPLTLLLVYALLAPLVGTALLVLLAPYWQNIFSSIEPRLLLLLLCLSGSLAVGLALVPSIVLAALFGYFFGNGLYAYVGFLSSLAIATWLGLGLASLLSRNAIEKLCELYPKAKVLLLDVEKKAGHGLWFFLFTLRLSPQMPFAFTNLIVAQLQLPLIKLWFFSWLGLVPRSLLAVAAGSLLGEIEDIFAIELNRGWTVMFTLVFLATIVWAVFRIRRIYRTEQKT